MLTDGGRSRRRTARLGVAAAVVVASLAWLTVALVAGGNDEEASVEAGSPGTGAPSVEGVAAGEDVPADPNRGVFATPEEDPVDVAWAYLASRVGDAGTTTASAFVHGDAVIGEVAFRGDVETVVLPVQDLQGWYIEAAVHDTLTPELREDGTAVVRSLEAGTLVHRHRTAGEVRELSRQPVEADGEVVVRPAEGGTNQLTLERADGTVVLVETRGIQPPGPSPRIPDAPAGDDPGAVAVEYLTARLGWPPSGASDFRSESGVTGVAEWDGGRVHLLYERGRWHVSAAVGATITFRSAGVTGPELVTVRATTGDAGTLRLLAVDERGRSCASWTAEVGRAGEVETAAATSCETVAAVRAFFEERDGGFSFAETVT